MPNQVDTAVKPVKICSFCGFRLTPDMRAAYENEWCPSCGGSIPTDEVKSIKHTAVVIGLKLLRAVQLQITVVKMGELTGQTPEEIKRILEKSEALLRHSQVIQHVTQTQGKQTHLSVAAYLRYLEQEDVRKLIVSVLTILKALRDDSKLDLHSLECDVEYYELDELVDRLDEAIQDISVPVKFI